MLKAQEIEMNGISSTSRFSNRAENYARYRPGYPSALFDFIEKTIGLHPKAGIVDIGSGTGLFAEPLLHRGYPVACIEPNEDMQKAGEKRLNKYPLFQSFRTTAEDTGLAAQSADLITIAQTFHWLDPVAARIECKRILKPGGQVILAWNRQENKTEFEKKYSAVRAKYRIVEKGPVQIEPQLITEFFFPEKATLKVFPNMQLLDFEGLKGQLLSKSYVPLPGHELYDAMITDLIKLFVTYNENGLVRINYETLLYWGKLSD
jgi:SAM-dependent methyltransferase